MKKENETKVEKENSLVLTKENALAEIQAALLSPATVSLSDIQSSFFPYLFFDHKNEYVLSFSGGTLKTPLTYCYVTSREMTRDVEGSKYTNRCYKGGESMSGYEQSIIAGQEPGFCHLVWLQGLGLATWEAFKGQILLSKSLLEKSSLKEKKACRFLSLDYSAFQRSAKAGKYISGTAKEGKQFDCLPMSKEIWEELTQCILSSSDKIKEFLAK